MADKDKDYVQELMNRVWKRACPTQKEIRWTPKVYRQIAKKILDTYQITINLATIKSTATLKFKSVYGKKFRAIILLIYYAEEYSMTENVKDLLKYSKTQSESKSPLNAAEILLDTWGQFKRKTSVIVEPQETEQGREVQRHLHDKGFRLMEQLMKYPQLRPYIYGDKKYDEVSQEDANTQSRLDTILEMGADFWRECVIQIRYIPEIDREYWLTFIRGMYEASHSMQQYLNGNKKLYNEIFHILDSEQSFAIGKQ